MKTNSVHVVQLLITTKGQIRLLLATLRMKLFFLYTHLFTNNIFAFCAIKGGLHGTDY